MQLLTVVHGACAMGIRNATPVTLPDFWCIVFRIACRVVWLNQLQCLHFLHGLKPGRSVGVWQCPCISWKPLFFFAVGIGSKCGENRIVTSRILCTILICVEPVLLWASPEYIHRDIQKDASWWMMFTDDGVLIEESREHVENDLRRWRHLLEMHGLPISRENGLQVTHIFRWQHQAYFCVSEQLVHTTSVHVSVGSTVQENGGEKWEN